VNKKVWIFAGLLVGLVALVAVSKMNSAGKAKEVELATVKAQPLRSSILASGTLAYREQVQLRSEVIAKVKALHVKEGDRVRKGELIVELDPKTFQAQVEQQEARVRMEKIAIQRQRLQNKNLARQFKRQKDLFNKALVDTDSYQAKENELALSRVDLRSREESLSQAQAALDQAREQLAKTRILSPIDGIVIKVDVKVGETVISGTTNIAGSGLGVVADPSSMLAEVQVDEADIAQIHVDQAAELFAAALPDSAIPGTVESIANVAERAQGQQSLSFLVKIVLDDAKAPAVRPGMSVRADIFTETSDSTLAVPVQAVRYDEDSDDEDKAKKPAQAKAKDEQAYVFVVEENKALRRDVKLGISSDSDQEITHGLKAGETVVTGPYRILRHLKAGESVKARSEETAVAKAAG